LENLITYVLFAIGLYVLVRGADFLVDGATSVARRFGLPEITIGLTIVAFGTSLPEIAYFFGASRWQIVRSEVPFSRRRGLMSR